MTLYSYRLPSGAELLVEAEIGADFGPVPAAKDGAGALRVQREFESCLTGVNEAAAALLERFKGLAPSEITLTFGLKATGEVGLFAVAKGGAEANFQVTIRWNEPKAERPLPAAAESG